MSAPVWPLSLPQIPQQSSYSEELPYSILRYEMDFGSKVRNEGFAKPEAYTVSYILTDEQYHMLRNFIKLTLANGAIAFDFPHPVSGTYVRAGFLKDGDSILKRSVYQQSTFWQVQLKLEIFDDVGIA